MSTSPATPSKARSLSPARAGKWSAIAEVILGVAYLATGAAWMSAAPKGANPFEPSEPYLTILENLIILSALVFVVLMSAVYAGAAEGAAVTSLAALTFAGVFAALTTSVHFVQLTVLRQTQPAPPRWPSTPMALDMLAWDLFLGLSLLLAAPVFSGGGLQTAVRVAMSLSGLLCVAGILGPALGDLRLQLLATAGYAVGLPVVSALLAVVFARADRR